MRIVAVGPENRPRAFIFGSLGRLCVLLASWPATQADHPRKPIVGGGKRPFNRITQKFLDFALPDGEFEGDRQDVLGRTEASW